MIEFRKVTKKYNRQVAIEDVDLIVERGEIFTLIGPSGSGKTTILRLMNLLESPDMGKIIFEGEDTAGSKKDRIRMRRRMGLVFQKPVAFRGTVADNVGSGLRFRHAPSGEILSRVMEVLDLVGLSGYQDREARSLSGGEMQRVAIARALAPHPDLLLLDEPTANLDPLCCNQIEMLISRINTESGMTIVLCTHDLLQGQNLATRMAVIIGGTIRQIGDAGEIFYRPHDQNVARFVGTDNVIEGIVTFNDNGLATVDCSGLLLLALTTAQPGSPVTIYLRAEDITLSTANTGKTSARNEFLGVVSRLIPLGAQIRVRVDTPTPMIALVTRRSAEDLDLKPGKEVHLSFKASSLHVTLRPIQT